MPESPGIRVCGYILKSVTVRLAGVTADAGIAINANTSKKRNTVNVICAIEC
ncbi:MAG: hypothetical protein Q4Q53_08295 [Methanocorpusculum sp.]|nr:hypothetical protein [Methanocorpusculum sp.]